MDYCSEEASCCYPAVPAAFVDVSAVFDVSCDYSQPRCSRYLSNVAAESGAVDNCAPAAASAAVVAGDYCNMRYYDYS